MRRWLEARDRLAESLLGAQGAMAGRSAGRQARRPEGRQEPWRGDAPRPRGPRRDEHTPRLPITIRGWLLLLALAYGFYSFVLSERGILALFDLERETRTLAQSAEVLEAERAHLTAERDALAGGETVERHARERYIYHLPDEEVYVLPALPESE